MKYPLMHKLTTVSISTTLLALSLLCVQAWGQDRGQPAEADGLLFADDFSTGDLSRHNDHFRWGGSGDIYAPGANADRIEEIAGPDGEMVNALRFHYLGQSNPEGPSNWSEVRFHLTESVDEARTESGASNVAHREVWVSYATKIPENYHHSAGRLRNQKG